MDIKKYFRTIIILCFTLVSTLCTAQEEVRYIYEFEGDRIIHNGSPKLGQYYKLEVICLSVISKNDPEMKRLQKLGNLSTQKLDSKNKECLLIGDFETLNEAKQKAKKIHKMGFTNTKVYLYEDGFRKRSW